MHRKVKGLLSLIVTFAMVTVTATPVLADELSGEEQVSLEEQAIVEVIEAQTETVGVGEIAQQNVAEEESAAEVLTAEVEPAEQNTETVELVLDSSTDTDIDLDSLYNSLTEEQRKFNVYAGERALSKVIEETDVLSKLVFEGEIAPDASNLDTESGRFIGLILGKREGDLTFYRLSKWNVWKVDCDGIPKKVVASRSSLSKLATESNFKQSAYLANGGTGTAPVILFSRPILEPVWSCLDYVIPVYDGNGNDTGMTITINAENYNDALQVFFPEVEANSWKFIYDGEEYQLNTASEIWTNETNGIRRIGKNDFDESKARLQAVVSQTELQDGIAEFAQPDWYEGQPMAAPIVSSETNGVENITYYYKEAGADDSAYTTTIPDKVGTYTAKAIFAKTDKYKEVVKTADFNILPVQVELQEGTAEFSQPDWYEGQPKPEPIVSSETNGVDNITYFYKEAGADDSSYTTTVPDKAGAYKAAAVFAATENYKEVIKFADFNILEAIPVTPVLQEGTADFKQPDWHEGQPMAAPIVSSETNGVENITYYYREQGADDSTYTTAVPDKAGKYTAKAVFAATEFYLEVIRTSDFEILPSIPVVEVDETAPSISGVSNGQTYYGDQAVSVIDEHLQTVTVNGEAVEISDNRVDITLKPAEGAYKIIATDEAGNKTEYTIEILETWVRDGINDNGKKKLRRERKYKLGSSQWTVGGDSTVYSSGITFYVKNGGEYDFSKK